MAVGGNKSMMAARLSEAGIASSPGTGLPSKGQLTYIAAVCRRQNRSPTMEILMHKENASRWLNQYGDYSAGAQ